MTRVAVPPRSAKPLKLGFLSPHNPYDRSAFSGTSYFAARALEQHPGIDLRILGNHAPQTPLDRLLRRRPAPLDARQLDPDGLDAVLGLAATPFLDQMATRHPDMPLVHVTDATPEFLRDAYGWAIPGGADEAEHRVAGHAAITVYSSDVMARRAPDDLGLPGLPVAALPFGVNLDDLPDLCPQKPSLNKLNLLFVGLDWVRKGGDIAVAVLDHLNATGHAAELTIVGRCPDRHRSHPAIHAAGFLNKAKPRDRDRLGMLYRDAHFLMLPSRGDCTPMVVTEALAHGTPVLASDTGGIAAQIGGPGAGRILPLHATPDMWAKTIIDITADPDGYAMLSDASFERATRVFNWDSWAEGITALTRDVLAGHHRQAPRIALVG